MVVGELSGFASKVPTMKSPTAIVTNFNPTGLTPQRQTSRNTTGISG
jgi:hypothetical protein